MSRDVIDAYFTAFNTGDVEGMLALLTEDVEHHVNQGGVRRGKDAFRAFCDHMNRCYREKLSDIVILTEPSGSRAAAEFQVEGTYLKTDEGLPPATGQDYDLPAGSVLRTQGRAHRAGHHLLQSRGLAGAGLAVTLRVAALTGPALEAALDEVARLRIAVFRDWPYLYDGDAAYERRYLETYRDSPGAILVGARDGDRLVGASTGTPMEDHADDFGAPFAERGLALDEIFYCAESVLLPEYRGQGIGHRFFDLREAHARALGRRRVAFCAVERPADHPLRPAGYRPLDGFWRARGYAPLHGAVARFAWKDVDAPRETEKPLRFWMKEL